MRDPAVAIDTGLSVFYRLIVHFLPRRLLRGPGS